VTLDDLRAEALKLAPEARAALAHSLVLGLDVDSEPLRDPSSRSANPAGRKMAREIMRG